MNRALEMVGLVDKADTDVKTVGGQLQRSVIARALASEADFLLWMSLCWSGSALEKFSTEIVR